MLDLKILFKGQTIFIQKKKGLEINSKDTPFPTNLHGLHKYGPGPMDSLLWTRSIGLRN